MQFIGTGVLTIDIVQLCNAEFEPEQSVAFYAAGGTIANVLAYLSVLNASAQCLVIGAIGDDDLGSAALTDLSSFGVRCDFVERLAVSSRRIMHLISRSHRHLFSTRCTWCQRVFPRFPRYSPPSAWNQVNFRPQRAVLLIDRITEFAAKLARELAPAAAVVFEPTRVANDDDVLRELVRVARIVKFAADIPDRDRLVMAFDQEPHVGWKLLVETHGSDGISIRTQDKQISIRIHGVPSVDVLDEAGAGDACTAGFLTALGASLLDTKLPSPHLIDEAARRAQALGAITCAFYGAKGPLYALSAGELRRRVDETLLANRVFDVRPASLPPAMSVPAAVPNACRICRLPL